MMTSPKQNPTAPAPEPAKAGRLSIGSKRGRDDSNDGDSRLTTHTEGSNGATAPPLPPPVHDVDAVAPSGSRAATAHTTTSGSSTTTSAGHGPGKTNRSPPVVRARAESESLHGPSAAAAAGVDKRMRQPTLAVYGMVSDTAALKKEITDRDTAIDDLKERVCALEDELNRRDAQIEHADRQTQHYAARIGHYHTAMRAEMLKAATASRSEARRLLYQQHYELGHVTTWQPTNKDVWIEGNKMRELIPEHRELTETRERLAAARRAANAVVRKLSDQMEPDGEDSVGLETKMELLDALEEHGLRNAEYVAVSARLSEVEQQMSAIELQKKAFLKEIRRIADEDTSEFLVIPAIGESGRYVLMHLLGKGGFSEVWKAFDLEAGVYVACKIHHVRRDWNEPTRQHYMKHANRELAITRQLQHPHLTRLHDVFQHDQYRFVSVMEFSGGTDLDTYLKRFGSMKEADTRLVIMQMVSALRYLASLPQPVIHYDLKPANILLHSPDSSVLDIKITDFGLSKIMDAELSDNPDIELTSQGTGTYWYLPPECFMDGKPRVSCKVDVWSVGVIMYQMLYGRRPFAEGVSQHRIWNEKSILQAARHLTFPDAPRVSDDAKDFIRRCLTYEVSERYDVFQLSLHPYLLRITKKTKRDLPAVASS